MLSTALKRAGATAALIWMSTAALADEREPVYLTDPTFQIRYDKRLVEFEPMPLAVLQRCQQTSGLSNVAPVFFIYGRSIDTQGRVFYATGGYEIRTNPDAEAPPKYHVGGLGLLFFIDGNECTESGPIMETFSTVDDEFRDALSGLATDMASRYEKAFKSPEALKLAFQKNGVKANKHASELYKAFALYFVK